MMYGRTHGADARLMVDPSATGAARPLDDEAPANELAALGRDLRRAAMALASRLNRWLVRPLTRQVRRRRAIAQLGQLDARLLADIGLRRSDIELAVDGHLASDRLRHPRWRGTPAPATSLRPVPAEVVQLEITDRRRDPVGAKRPIDLPRAS